MTILDRLRDGPPLLLDGAMGTELDRRGVAMDAKAWSASGLAGEAAMVRAVHDDYIAAGAQVHIVNSFALARHVLAPAGLGEQVAALNRQAVEICRAALTAAPDGRPQWVAGSLSTYAAQSDRSALPRGAALVANAAEQALVLKDAGCDLLRAGDAVRRGDHPGPARGGGALGPAGDARLHLHLGPGRQERRGLGARRGLAAHDPGGGPWPACCRRYPRVCRGSWRSCTRTWTSPTRRWRSSGPAGTARTRSIPTPGASNIPTGASIRSAAPEAFVTAAERWIDGGARLVGGCCGIGPAHINALGAKLGAL